MIGELTCRIIKNRELTALMVTHDLRQALEFGNRTIMMDQGQIILDLQDPDRASMTVDDLLDQFEAVRGKRLLDDRVLLV